MIWYAGKEWRRLGPRARVLLERADRGEVLILIPMMALVEVAESAHRGRIFLREGFAEWAAALLASGSFSFIDLTWEIVLVAQGLYQIRERPDRLIAATAIYFDHPLITRDPDSAGAAGVDTVW